jgi:hypothetical protein
MATFGMWAAGGLEFSHNETAPDFGIEPFLGLW